MYFFPVALIGKMLERFFLFLYRSHTIWTDAESTVNELVRFGIPRKNCAAVSCPSGIVSLPSRPKKNTTPTFIFVGRLVAMKRIDDVLEAFHFIRKKLPNATLWIVGEGYRKQSDHVTWYGKVSVVYRVPGLVDTVKDGVTGVTVGEHPIELAQEALKLFTDKTTYERMQKAAAVYNDSFRWSDTAEQSYTLIRKAYEAQR